MVKFVIIGTDECGYDFHAGSYSVPREYVEDEAFISVLLALEDKYLADARASYPEARGFSIEREISSMSYTELMEYGSGMGWL